MPRAERDRSSEEDSLSATSSDSGDSDKGDGAARTMRVFGAIAGVDAASREAQGKEGGIREERAAVKIQSVMRGKRTRRQSTSEQLGGENYAGPDGELAAGLFSGWTLHAAPNGKQYWHHKVSGASEWTEPKSCRAYREATTAEGWTVHPAPNGLPYWHNAITNESVWVEPSAMKRRRVEYAAHERSVQKMQLVSPTKNGRFSALSAFTTPAEGTDSSPTSGAVVPRKPAQKTTKMTAVGSSRPKNVAHVLQQLRRNCADTDPSEAFRLFALSASGRGDFIPVSVFATSIMKICPGVDKTLAASAADVFDRAGAGLVSEKSFVDIVYDRAELELRAAHLIHEKMLVVMSELRDILATQVQADGTRGFSATDLRRHFNNMKRRPQDEHVSRGQLVKVLLDIGLHASSDVLHAVADEFVPLSKNSMTFKKFVSVVKRESDHAGTHKELMQRRAEKARQRRPRPTPTARTKREANAILARFQKHFQMQTTSIEHLHTVFEGFDRYADGHIQRSDFMLAMKELDFSRSHEALNVVIDMLDPEQTGHIAWHDFFDTLATDATSGLTPRCLSVDSLAKSNPRGASRAHRHHGYTMSPSRRRIMKKQRPPQYPAFHEMESGDAEHKRSVAEAEAIIEALRKRMARGAAELAEGASAKNNANAEKKEAGERKVKLNLDLTVPGAIAADTATAVAVVRETRLLGYCVDVFDMLDKTKTGVLSAAKLFRYLKTLKLSTPAPKLELLWHVVSLVDKSGDGTIHLYDWLFVTAPKALLALADDMLFHIRTMYHENLTDQAGQAAFFNMFRDVEESTSPGIDVPVEVVPLTKFLSAVAALEREELSSIAARYLWGRLAGEDASSMLWTEFLVAMTDRTGKFGFTPRPFEAKVSPRSKRRDSAGGVPSGSVLFSPTSRIDSIEGGGTHRSVADRAIEERISRVWEDLLTIMEPEPGTSQWQKLDTMRVEFAEVAEAGGEALGHKQFVRLLRNLGVFEQGNVMDRVTKEFDVKDSGRISWSDFIVGLLERPIRGDVKTQTYGPVTRLNARAVFRCVRTYFEKDKAAMSPRAAAGDSTFDVAEETLEQRIGHLFEVFSASFTYGGEDEEEVVSGMTYDDFKRMLAFMCDAGTVEGKHEMGQVLSDPETMEYMCLLFDHDRNGTISAEEIMACVMPQNVFRDKVLRAKLKRRARRASEMEVKNDEAEGWEEEEEEPHRRSKDEKEQKWEQERHAEDEKEAEGKKVKRSGEVEGGANFKTAAAERSNRGTEQEENFGEEEVVNVEDLLCGTQGPLGGDSAVPNFEDNNVELGASLEFDPAATDEPLEQDMGRTQNRDSIGEQLRYNKERLAVLMKISDDNSQLCNEIESSRLFLDRRNRLQDADKVVYREVPDVTKLVDADVIGKHRSVLEAVTLHAGLSNIAPQGALTGNTWSTSGKLHSEKIGSMVGGGTERTFQRSLAQWNSALDTWTRVLDAANITMRRVSITAGTGHMSPEDAKAVQASLSQVSKEVRSTKMQVYRESDYWFERSATRQSGTLRFVRNLSAPPQHVYERMLTISSAFRDVEARILKIRELLRQHTPRGEGGGGGEGNGLKEPKPPVGNGPANGDSAIVVAAKSPKQVQLLARIKKKEKILRHRRRKELNAALVARGVPWPPVLVDAPAWCLRLHDRFVAVGASAVPSEEGIRERLPDDEKSAVADGNTVKIKALQKGMNKGMVKKGLPHEMEVKQSLDAINAKDGPATAETWTRRLVDRVADMLVAGVGKARRQNRTEALARGHLTQRTRELEMALATVGLGNALPAIVVTAPYNAYVTQTLPSNVWITIAKICHRLEERRRARLKSLARVFRSIDVRGTGVIDHKTVIRFAVRRQHLRREYFLPKCVSVLLQGRRYRAALREASAKKDGRVSLEDFEAWAMARWVPRLPGTAAAARKLRKMAKRGEGCVD